MPPDEVEHAMSEDVLHSLARYALDTDVEYETALRSARYSLLDALGCALLALRVPDCSRLLGPYVTDTLVPHGSRVPGTPYVLDPIKAAFDLGTMIRWLDFNDTWLAAEWGHPSDSLGGILMLADHLSQLRVSRGEPPVRMRAVLGALIKAYEIQGTLALQNSFNRVGVDHVLLVEVATAAAAAALLGAREPEMVSALSHAWMDGGPLRAYRHLPETGPRKSWAAGDATSRGVRLALMAHGGEAGYPHVLTTPVWGFAAARMHGQPIRLSAPLGTHIIEHILFKLPYPTEFHGQTAVEAALRLYPAVYQRLNEIARVVITTQESARRIIDKEGPLYNAADRDHCIQYMVAFALINGRLTADDYSDVAAADPRIDALRAKTAVTEDMQFSRDYLDPDKRSVANAVQVMFTDGTATERVQIEYPLGHPRRRAEALPVLERKFADALATRFPPTQVARIQEISYDQQLEELPVHEYVRLYIPSAPVTHDD